MNNFSYSRAADVNGALRLAAAPGAQFIAGGTNLVDLMKGGVLNPSRLVDITKIAGLAQIVELPSGGIRIRRARDKRCRRESSHDQKPLSAPIAGVPIGRIAPASQYGHGGRQYAATALRCGYFYDTAFDQCNKRRPVPGAPPLEGLNRNHAIFGASGQCIATHPSDMCVALVALDAMVELRSARGSRHVPMREFQRLPGDTPHLDTQLSPGEMITAVDLPSNGFQEHSFYLKVRDRASYAFALMSVAAALDLPRRHHQERPRRDGRRRS